MMPIKFWQSYMMGQQEDILVREMTAHKVLRVGYYWPTLFKDAHAYAWKCQIFQVNVGRERKPTFQLHPVMVQNPFE